MFKRKKKYYAKIRSGFFKFRVFFFIFLLWISLYSSQLLVLGHNLHFCGKNVKFCTFWRSKIQLLQLWWCTPFLYFSNYVFESDITVHFLPFCHTVCCGEYKRSIYSKKECTFRSSFHKWSNIHNVSTLNKYKKNAFFGNNDERLITFWISFPLIAGQIMSS